MPHFTQGAALAFAVEMDVDIRPPLPGDRLGGGQIETHGHAAQKGPETPRVQLPHRPAQGVRSRAAIGAVTGKGDGCAAIGDHASKGKALARTLQAPLLN